MNAIFVTNRNAEPHIDYYDGEEFVFPPNEPVLVPIPAAEHMLGYGLEDKTSVLQRLGWATRFDPKTRNLEENTDGVRRLASFVFEEADVRPKSPLAALMDDQPAAA